MVREWEFNVAGVNVNRNRIRQCMACEEGDAVSFRRDPLNEHDPNAIEVWVRRKQIGFVPAEVAAIWAPHLAASEASLSGTVAKVFAWNGPHGKYLAGMTLFVNAQSSSHASIAWIESCDSELPESLREWKAAEEAFPTFDPDDDWSPPSTNSRKPGCVGSLLVMLVVLASVLIAKVH